MSSNAPIPDHSVIETARSSRPTSAAVTTTDMPDAVVLPYHIAPRRQLEQVPPAPATAAISDQSVLPPPVTLAMLVILVSVDAIITST